MRAPERLLMKSILDTIYEITKMVVFVLLAAFILRSFLIQPFVVDGQSMEPNFQNQEYLIVEKLSYKLHQPQRGDVIVFRAPSNPEYDYIKRIIALPGETVTVKMGQIYINGNELEENYLSKGEKTLIGSDEKMTLERTLGANEYFVLGDNRDHSSDSREFGVLAEKMIIGRAWVSVYPWEFFGTIKNPQYIFNY